MATFTSVSVKEFMLDEAFTQWVKPVKVNKNGYPFITFVTAANVATNVYFSIAASKTVTVGQVIEGSLLKTYVVVLTTNATGEERYKLASPSESLRGDIDDL